MSSAIDRALGCLRANFRSASDKTGGWYHYFDNPLPGVTASAVGLYSFGLAETQFERSDEVIRYLLSRQVNSESNKHGGWSVHAGFPIIESTAWIVRSLSIPSVRGPQTAQSLRLGAEYIERNQNADFGWGSYFGQPSRVFHTALSILALQECGGNKVVIENAQKWLIHAQNSREPAWGYFPGSEPTLLHTSFALMALLQIRDTLSANTVRESAEWLLARLEPGVHVEQSTAVEEFDVPYPEGTPIVTFEGTATTTFQNSLPHFAGPVAITAILSAGLDHLQPKIFDAVQAILDTQLENGAWELPRSPTRTSIWALWPFLAALSKARSTILPAGIGQADLLFPGCMIVQNEDAQTKLTALLLVRGMTFDWLRRRRTAIVLWLTALFTAAIPLILLFAGMLKIIEFITALVIPTLLLVFQLIWGRNDKTDASRTLAR